MQVFFSLSYTGIDSNKWSKKKFHEIVTTYIKSFENVQINDLLETCNWNIYHCLINVADEAEALAVRKEVERLCKTVNSKCRPLYFRHRKTDATIDEVNILGLTRDEYKAYCALAPKGVIRHMSV